MSSASGGEGRDLKQDERIHVLLVDDNEQWAEYIQNELEGQTDGLEVSTAFSANEARVSLNEDSFDCVVADYHMPEADGIQLLETVREDSPELPFILVTGEGSENVASRAIERGVTDYIKKDPRADQINLFANRIEKAVEQYRLRRRIEESEERYRTVTEQTQEGVLILRKGSIVFCNERLSEVTGKERENLSGGDTDFVEDLVHPEDAEDVRATVGEWRRGDTEGGLHTARLVADDGTVLHCEYTGRRISYRGEPATLVSVRDVTSRERRRRRRRKRRELNRGIQETLVESRTLEGLEEAIADHLREYGYDFVWIGSFEDGEPRTRVSQGGDENAEELGSTVEGDSSEPRLSASEKREPQFVGDIEDLFSADWGELALDSGYRSCAALPLVHEDVSYGTLAVYSRDTKQFDEVERKVLKQTADVVAMGVHSLETQRALTSDNPVEVELELAGSGYYLVEMLSDTRFDVSSAEVEVTGTHPHTEGGVVQYVTLTDVAPERFERAADDETAVEEVSRITDEEEEDPRVQLTVAEPTPESELGSMGAVIRSTEVTPNGAKLRIELPGREKLSSVVDTLEEGYGKASVLSCVEAEGGTDIGGMLLIDTLDLTEKQEVALEAAYHHGYFEQPRESSASEIAESLDVSHSTYLQHLRIAQGKVFENLYD